MDIKEIARKFVAGEDVKELIKDFDETKIVEYRREVKSLAEAEAEAERGKVTGLRNERQRLETDLQGKTEEIKKKAQDEVTTKIRTEQIAKARSRFMAEQGLDEEKMKSIDESFKTEDSGKIDADLIIPDFRKAYAKANADKLIQAERDAAASARAAAEFMAGAAGAGNPGGGSPDQGKKYSPAVLDMVREAAKKGIPLSPEQAERGMKGGKRVFS